MNNGNWSINIDFSQNNKVSRKTPNKTTIIYNGKPYEQTLSINKGPIIRPINKYTSGSITNPICYPTTHSIPGPFLQSYIALPNRVFPY